MSLTSPEPRPRAAVERCPGRAAFAFIFVTVTLDMLALGMGIPVLPQLLIQLKGGNVAGAAAVAGVFGFAWAAMQFLFSPLLGALSDRFGRRPVILLSNLGLGLDSILLALAPSIPWLFAGRVLSGITSASFSTANAYVADVTPTDQRAARFGLLGAAFGVGFIAGPALGGWLGGHGLRLPFWAAAALSLLNFIYGLFVLPESLPPESRAPLRLDSAHPLASLGLLRGSPALLGLASAAFLYFLAHESLPSLFVLYTGYRYGWTSGQEGFVLALVGAASGLVSALLVGPTVARLGERRALAVGLSFGVCAFVVYALAPTGAVFLCGIPLIGLWSLSGPSMQALMSRRVNVDQQGRLQGALTSLRGVSGMIGPLLFTQVFAFAITGAGRFSGLPYLLAATLTAGSLAWGLRASSDEPVV